MVVVDTNVILAFLLTRGITHRIISAHKDIFIALESCYDELWEHRGRWNKNNLSDEELEVIIEKVKKYFVDPIKSDYYKDNIKRAEGIIKDNDTEEVKGYARILGTKEVLKLYPLKESAGRIIENFRDAER